jgi:hypothetical protein
VALSRVRLSSKPLPLLLHTMNPIDPAPGRFQALWVSRRRRRLTLFGRSVILIGCELLANAVCWVIAGILFGGHNNTQPILGLALLAWVCVPVLFSRQTTHIINFVLFFSFLRQSDCGMVRRSSSSTIDEGYYLCNPPSPLAALDADHIR